MIIKKNIAIFGFGSEGVSAVNFLGKNNRVSIFDDKDQESIDKSTFKKLKVKNVKFYFSGKKPEDEKFEMCIRSPGVRPNHPNIEFYKKKGTKLTSPTNIFFENCPAKIIGVTGTKGKGTTSTLIYEIVGGTTKNVFLAGNIGTPALEILPKLNKNSTVILELSSFQLTDLKYSPHIAVVLMVTSEHLDWHKNLAEYRQAKESIVKFQTSRDFAVINQDFEASKRLVKLTKAKIYFFSTLDETNGVFLENGEVISSIHGREEIIKNSKILLAGKHNLQNVCAATLVSKILNISNQSISNALSTFKGLKHRLQLVKEVQGVKYYNDSYSTIPETTIAAIEALPGPKILILGGSSKKSDFTALADHIVSDIKIKAIILIGKEAHKIKKSLLLAGGFRGKLIENLTDMKDIVKSAQSTAQRGDSVILSPACASFDMFANYEDRGQQFTDGVLKIK